MSVTDQNAERIIIFDTTLRDGEQSPGASMILEEKCRIAQLLDQMGVDVIEAGFPIASQGDFEAVSAISRSVTTASICALARAKARDIDRAMQALEGAQRPRIHTFISTSPLHMKHKLSMTPEQVLEAVHSSVTRARRYVDDVEWSAEDATRSEFPFLCQCIDTAIDAGARTINIPDTLGYAVPFEFCALIEKLQAHILSKKHKDVILSVHCHNDLGLAVANSLAGVHGGARQIECTINGLGERAGNAALEEIVMAVTTRHDALPFSTGINTKLFMQISHLVSAYSGFPVQYNKAIVGKNAFVHEAGIHQDGMLKNAQTYEIMRPADVGVSETRLAMGKHSGSHAFQDKLESLGYHLDDKALTKAFRRFKDLADRKKQIYDEDIAALVEDEIAVKNTTGAHLLSLTVLAGTGQGQHAVVTIEIDGKHHTCHAKGDGPVDATFNAIRSILPHEATLELYQVHAVTEGTDAQAEVSVRLEWKGHITTGRAADTDTLVASARAYIAALNKMQLFAQKKQSTLI